MKWLAVLGVLISKFFGWLSSKQARAGGIAEQKAADADQLARNRESDREVHENVTAADDAELNRMRNKWTKPSDR